MNKLVQFRFGEKGIQAVEKLKQDLALSSRAEVMRLAINLLSWAIDCIENGYEITITNGEGKFERIRLPFLELRNLTKQDFHENSETVSSRIKEKTCI